MTWKAKRNLTKTTKHDIIITVVDIEVNVKLTGTVFPTGGERAHGTIKSVGPEAASTEATPKHATTPEELLKASSEPLKKRLKSLKLLWTGP